MVSALERFHCIKHAFCMPMECLNALQWLQVTSVAEWLAGWTTKAAIPGSISGPVTAEIATSNSVLGDYLIGNCCQQCWPSLNAGEVKALSLNTAENTLFHSNQVEALVGYKTITLP